MAEVHEEIIFEGGNDLYRAYLNDKDNLFITEVQPDDELYSRYIVIDKDEWNDFKNFVDRQFSELEQ